MSFIDPLWLILLPLSALPFMVSISDKTTISSIKIFEQDNISKKLLYCADSYVADYYPNDCCPRKSLVEINIYY